MMTKRILNYHEKSIHIVFNFATHVRGSSRDGAKRSDDEQIAPSIS